MEEKYEQKYLVVHKYNNTGDAIYLVSKKDISSFAEHYDGRTEYIFEYDFGKLKDVLIEVEVKVQPVEITAKSNE